ncbi:MAG TPA: 2-oxoacid:acceptor oxidoreductase family protein, partial [Hyphomicrobiaceae bacterium]|nr:2-oxoacid:acceptor oxidoreductase family protein [Hyphomicrobiaceae bacterium]
IGPSRAQMHAARIPDGQADLVLGCDLVVTASNKVLETIRPDHTTVIYSTYEMMIADFTRKPDFKLPGLELRRAIEDRARKAPVLGLDAHSYALDLFGDSIASNMFMLGVAFQRGAIPVTATSIEKAIELNGAQIEMNRQAFRFGRLAAHDIAAVDRIIAQSKQEKAAAKPRSLDDIVAYRVEHLKGYQDAALAERYRSRVSAVATLEREKTPGRTGLADAVAHGYFKLLAYKDEYEVARLYTDGRFEKALAENFDGELKLEFHLAPPLLSWFSRDKATGHPRKMSFGKWMLPAFRLLARGKRLRGGMLDVFGYTAERRLERQMIADYERLLDEIGTRLAPETHGIALALARLPEDIKGFGHVKHGNYEAVRRRETALVARLRDPKAPPALKAAE